MGVIAHLRQQILDAKHYRDQWNHSKTHGGARVPADPSLETILVALDGKLPVWWQAETLDEIHRALDLSKEFGFKPVIVGGREAFKTVDRLKAEKVPVILRVNHPPKPKVPTAAEFAKKPAQERIEPLRVQQDQLDRWKKRVATAGVLNKAGVSIAFSTDGLQRSEQFLEKIRDIIAAGGFCDGDQNQESEESHEQIPGEVKDHSTARKTITDGGKAHEEVARVGDT